MQKNKIYASLGTFILGVAYFFSICPYLLYLLITWKSNEQTYKIFYDHRLDGFISFAGLLLIFSGLWAIHKKSYDPNIKNAKSAPYTNQNISWRIPFLKFEIPRNICLPLVKGRKAVKEGFILLIAGCVFFVAGLYFWLVIFLPEVINAFR